MGDPHGGRWNLPGRFSKTPPVPGPDLSSVGDRSPVDHPPSEQPGYPDLRTVNWERVRGRTGVRGSKNRSWSFLGGSCFRSGNSFDSESVR